MLMADNQLAYLHLQQAVEIKPDSSVLRFEI